MDEKAKLINSKGDGDESIRREIEYLLGRSRARGPREGRR
jgi:hypothetical protein